MHGVTERFIVYSDLHNYWVQRGGAGQVNFSGSLPRSVNNVLQPMLHPGFRNVFLFIKPVEGFIREFRR